MTAVEDDASTENELMAIYDHFMENNDVVLENNGFIDAGNNGVGGEGSSSSGGHLSEHPQEDIGI
jgi:hypothetical protein